MAQYIKDKRVAQLFDAGAHIGNKIYRWNPKMFPYLLQQHKDVHVIDIIQTKEFLKKACKYVKHAARSGKSFLFVGTKSRVKDIIKYEALRSGSFYISHRWYGGLLTNWRTVKRRIKKLKRFEREKHNLFAGLQKKETVKLRKQLNKMQFQLNGIKKMDKLPDIIIIIDQLHDFIAVREAIKLNIPVISMLDSNCNPDLVDIPIPGNDDSIEAVKLIVHTLNKSIIKGRAQRMLDGSPT